MGDAVRLQGVTENSKLMLPQFLTFIFLLNVESEDEWFNVNGSIKIDMEMKLLY